MTQRDEVQKFEQGRIRFLQEERLHIQKKTFTKWMNSFLQKARMEVDDLFVDLGDGRKLLKLLEIISGEKLAKPNNGKMRVHKIENVNKSLDFLHTKVRLESIGAEDIVDGNPRLILGLIWTIILRFQIQEIEIDVDEENESSEKKSAKDALLLWAQRKTNGYHGVNINDFSSSWRNGLGFNALIHSHRPDLFTYNDLQPSRHMDNLNHAFDVANNELGIPRLLDAEDIDTARPDEKSIMTYVASYYHTFARMKNEEKSGRRIAKIINQMVEADKMKIQYDRLTTDLLEWIQAKVVELEDREFPNSLEGIQTLLTAFGYYRTQEKPPKYKERSEIEALYFNVNTQLKELRQPMFNPADGKLVQDIERTWETLERAEHNREVALHSELRRQEHLEQLNHKFKKKSVLREGYLKEMIQVLSDPRYGSNLAQVDATVKKHEAISADILAREERFHDLTQMCDELVKENYRNSDQVKEREFQVLEKWRELIALLDKHKNNLTRMGNAISLLREMDTTLDSIQQLKSDLSSVDTGVHLLAVEELLQKHALQELQVTSLGDTERRLKRLGEQTAAQNPKEEEILRKKLVEVSEAFQDLQNSSAERKALLEEARNFYQFLQDQEDEEGWLVEKQRICQAGITAKDLRGVLSLQQKHKALLDEIKIRKNKFDQLGSTAKHLIAENHPRSSEIQQHITRNKQEWENLEKLADERTKQLQEAAAAYQFYADANEADSWLNEKTAILVSSDYGSDEPSAQALLQRHKDLQGELNAYNGDIQSLNAQAERLISAGISHFDLTAEPEVAETVEEVAYEFRMMPVDVWEDVVVEKTEHKTIVEERKVPQVKALYPFNDYGFTMQKGDVMFLLNKANPDWWCLRKADGSDGFAPANYVVEIEPRTIQIKVNKPEKVKATQKVKKTKMVKQKVPVKVQKPVKPFKRTVDDSNSVPKRQKKINDTYNQLKEMADNRHALLEDAIRLFRFYGECDDFEKWIKDKEKLLATDDPTESVDQAKAKYEKFVTDLSASNKRIDAIDAEVKEFEKQNHSQIDKVKARQRQVHAAWQRLNRLKAQKERSLAGASSVELFQRTCEEAKDWMLEKMTQLDTAALGQDLKTVQALQRRHQHLERELAPVEEKVNRVTILANSVKSAYPNELDNVAKRQGEIKDLWAKVKDKAAERRSRLEDAVGLQIFTNSSKDLLHWVATVKEQLNADNMVRDVQTAEELLKNHEDLGNEIKAKEDEFVQLTELGQQLLKSNPALPDVKGKLERLAEEQAALKRGWKEKEDWLQQCLQLQLFNKEADNIDAVTSAHQAFLEFSDLGNSLDEVEALLKQHRAFANTLVAQDERLAAFDKKADTLIAELHYDSDNIEDRRNQVLERRQLVKEACNARSQSLEASKNYHEFGAQVEDLRGWLAEKLKTASDESYRDLANLERKLQKHEAFERELRANEGQLRMVNKMGQALIAQDSYRKDDVAKTLRELNDEWQRLVGISLEKGRRLRQAVTQHNYNTFVEDVLTKLEQIEVKLASRNVGTDLRSCRDLLILHEMLENELTQCAIRVQELVNHSKEMAHDDHFDSDTVHNKALESQKRLESLDVPAKARRAGLEESLKFHKFRFELEAELQWIKEHIPLASSDALGQNLHQAQSLHKKHKKLEAEILGHQPVIDKTLQVGQSLIDQGHPESKQIEELNDTLQTSWYDLNEKAAERAQKLDLCVKAQQFFFEANEVESWLNERADILASTDYGRDRDAATKLLTKHKALELELETYSGIIAEMGRGANALVQTGHPDSKLIAERQSTLEHLVRSLQRRAALRQHRLMESLFRHEYFLESGELERWIAEQIQQASSEDYGQDYEHLLLLQAKFDDFKCRIEAGSERFRQCEDLAQKLIANNSPYLKDIERKQQQLEEPELSEAVQQVAEKHSKIRESYDKLRKQIANREQRLLAAGEIHRFHRDVADSVSRIHEKNAALGTELGRDLNSALLLLRKQEAFENELVVLEAQLQILVEDAARLQATYPNNKAQIQHKQQVVVSAWQGLKERADLRRDQLQASVDLQRFLTQVRDLMSWASNLRVAMNTDENVRSVARAQALIAEHEDLKIEIDAREENFRDTVDMSNAMEQTGHYAAGEAAERRNQLLEEREKLHNAYQLKKVYLDQLLDLHSFLREAKQLENISNAQEATLGNTDFGETVDEVASLVKKHDAFEKLVIAQDERLEALLQVGDKLISQKHFESAQIASKLADAQTKRTHIRQLCGQRRVQLDDALLYAEFLRDVGDAMSWISEKQKKLDAEIKTGEVHSLEDKIKKLQKHQAFVAEVAANEGRIKEIRKKGDLLVNKRHKNMKAIKAQLSELLRAWEALLREVNLHGKGLEEAQDILEFNNQLDKIEAWIRDKEVMVQSGETGRDYEHCQALQRKLDDVDSDMRVDDARIKTINALANRLTDQGHDGVQQRRDNFLRKWRNLQGALDDYRDRLAGAAEIHVFNRDVDDTSQRIAEKLLAMEVNDVGKDLTAVEALQRKQEALEIEMTTVENKLKEHDRDAYKLSQKYPESAESIQKKIEDLQQQWEQLLEAKQRRRDELDDAYTKQKFFADFKDLELWVADTTKRMESQNKPTSMTEAEALLELHDELKAEINGRQQSFADLIEFGQKLANDNPEVEEALNNLYNLQDNIHDAWDLHKQTLMHEYNIQDCKEMADQLDGWFASKEAFLNNDDIGDNPRAVEALIKKHDDFETTLGQQLTRVDEFEKAAKGILEETVHDNQEISKCLDNILSRRNNLIDATAIRKKKLEESQALQQFLRDLYEFEIWLSQKVQVADDENYRDPTNLQTKIQKHTAFEAEITANTGRLQNIIQKGQELIQSDHFASVEIQTRLDDLEGDWKHLLDLSQLKRERLNEAYQALLFNRTIDEFEVWLEQVESQLMSTDYGKDLATVTSLLKKHSAVENEVKQHTENCEAINEMAEMHVKNGHFLADELQDRAENVISRFHQLHGPMQARRDLLEASTMFQQFKRDVDDEMQWLLEREPLASSRDLGSNLTEVQSLQKKHQALESELALREPVVNAIGNRAANLVRSGHNESQMIELKANELKAALAHLQDLSSIRRLRLQDALESQLYYAEAAEAETWMREKKPLLTSGELGKDEDSTQSLQRKLEGLTLEVEAFKATLERLSKMSQNLIDRQHYDTPNIAAKQEQLEKRFKEIQQHLDSRAFRLSEALAYFSFIRECNEVQEWMTEQQAKAASEDYGEDVEHVELLTQQFETFLASLNNSEPRVQTCIDNGSALVEQKSGYTPKVEQTVNDLRTQWEELMELAHARHEALIGAKQVHTFDRTADETIAWINEKEAALAIDNYRQDLDLETIQALVRKHQAFENELLAVEEQVEMVKQEAQRLIDMFPDAEAHIDVKRDDVITAWEDLQIKAYKRRGNLRQAEQVQAYFDQHQDLLAWINEMLAKTTAPDLPQDVTGAELLIDRHNELKAEIEARTPTLQQFYDTGHNIQKDHFLAKEIEDRINNLQQRMALLSNTCKSRSEIYEQNRDLQVFKRDSNLLENWIDVRQKILKDDKVGDNIMHVEELIKKHEDFEKTIAAQGDKFAALRRTTLVEQAFARQLEAEARARQAEKERQEQEKLEQRKRLEIQKITEQRRQEHRDRSVDREQVNGGSYESKEGDSTISPLPSPPPPSGSSLTKSNSIAHMFDRERFRKGSDASVKRAESMKVGTKPVKQRTPSFTTRRRGSFRNKSAASDADLPPVEVQAFLDRKQVLMAGKKRAANRTWKLSYTVLCGQLLCFFKNRDDFANSKASSPPVNIHNSICTKADDYTKRKHTFRLQIVDGSEFLFSCNSDSEMYDWIGKISFRARLPPSQQLLNLELPKDQNEVEVSSQSSRTSSPDVPDPVVLRHDPQYQNGSTHYTTQRHTMGESPPPLPMTEPPNNYTVRRQHTFENSGDIHGGYSGSAPQNDWQGGRPVSMQVQPSDPKKSSRIKDLFKKKRPTSNM